MRFSFRLILLFGIATLSCSPVWADSADFQPNFIITDQDLTNSTSMTRSEIQAFLIDQGGALATVSLPDKDGIERPASDIIYQAAQTYHINPKYLLVKLQKEQSLLSARAPSQGQLDWATGYGVCDSCSTADPAIQKFKGFGIQVDSAAGIMRWYFDNVDNTLWIRRPGTSFLIDNLLISPTTKATAFLYTYTPHLEGNRNFWTLWQDWFSQIYPDGTLVKTKTSPAVYLITHGYRRPFTSMTALKSRFDPTSIITIAEADLKRYNEGAPMSYPNYSILRSGNDYYLLDYDTLRPFANQSVVWKFGYNPDEIIDITPDDLLGFATSSPINLNSQTVAAKVVKVQGTGSLYYIRDGVYQAIFDPQIATVNFPTLSVQTIHASSMEALSRGEPIPFRDGTVIAQKGLPGVYVVEKGKKRRIPSDDAFSALGYTKKQIVYVSPTLFESYEVGQPVYYH